MLVDQPVPPVSEGVHWVLASSGTVYGIGARSTLAIRRQRAFKRVDHMRLVYQTLGLLAANGMPRLFCCTCRGGTEI
jgi:hypothetical protein